MYTSVEGGSVKVWCFRNSWPNQIRIYFNSQSNGNIDLYRIQGFLVRKSLHVCSRYWTKTVCKTYARKLELVIRYRKSSVFYFPGHLEPSRLLYQKTSRISEIVFYSGACLCKHKTVYIENINLSKKGFIRVSGYFKQTLVVLKIFQMFWPVLLPDD